MCASLTLALPPRARERALQQTYRRPNILQTSKSAQHLQRKNLSSSRPSKSGCSRFRVANEKQQLLSLSSSQDSWEMPDSHHALLPQCPRDGSSRVDSNRPRGMAKLCLGGSHAFGPERETPAAACCQISGSCPALLLPRQVHSWEDLQRVSSSVWAGQGEEQPHPALLRD